MGDPTKESLLGPDQMGPLAHEELTGGLCFPFVYDMYQTRWVSHLEWDPRVRPRRVRLLTVNLVVN